MNSSSYYRAEIDGLRTIAILGVITYHASPNWLVGGYLGVDIFFVISGYLISRIIYFNSIADNFTYKNFIINRMRRLLPALLVLVMILMPILVFTLPPLDVKNFAKSILSVIYFFSNFHFWEISGYFSDANIYNPFIHTWSLSIEEQYYVIFPLIFLIIIKFNLTKHLLEIAFITIVLGLLGALYMSNNHPNASFFFPISRIYEFAMGTFAFAIQIDSRLRPSVHAIIDKLSIITPIGIGISFCLIGPYFIHPGIYTLIPTISVMLLLASKNMNIVLKIFLTNRFIVYIGLCSYSLYLYHQPVFAIYRNFYGSNLNILEIFFLIILCVILAASSYVYVEKPFRNADKISVKKLLTILIPGYLFITIIACLIYFNTDIVINQWAQNKSFEQIKTYQMIKNNRGLAEGESQSQFDLQHDNGCEKLFSSLNEIDQNWFDQCYKRFGKAEFVLGDSHSINLFRILIKSENDKFIIGLAQGGCALDRSKCNYYENFIKYLKQNRSYIKKVIYHQRGAYLLDSITGRPATFELDALPNSKLNGLFFSNTKKISEVYSYLNTLSQYSEIIWVGSRIEPRINSTVIMNKGCAYKWNVEQSIIDTFNDLDHDLIIYLRDKNNINYYSFNEIFKVNYDTDFMNCEKLYWRDETHLSIDGINLLASRYDKQKKIIFT